MLAVVLLCSLLFSISAGAWTSVKDFVPTSMAVGVHHHAVWADKGSSFGPIGKDILDKLVATNGMNAHVVRIDVSWAAFEPSKGRFQARPYGGKMEDTLTYLRVLGKKALIVINESPVWSHPSFTSSFKSLPDDATAYSGIGKWFHEYLAAWNDVLVGVEVFNEPNLAGPTGFDRAVTTARPAHYAECINAYYDAAKASSNPFLPVVFGAPEAIAVDPTKDPLSPRTNFIGIVYDHLRVNRGSKKPWDVMAVHVYPTVNAYTATEDWVSFYTHMKALQARMLREGDKSPIYITETGHSAHNDTSSVQPYNRGVTESAQASLTVGDINGVFADHPNVKLFIVYNDVMLGDPAATATAVQRDIHEYGFGILRYNTAATTKPIYAALRNAINSLPYPYASRLGTVVKNGTSDAIIDTAKNVWTINSSFKVVINGIVEANTYHVRKLFYGNNKVWQQNRDNKWWQKTSPQAAWSPSAGTVQGPGFVNCAKDNASARDLNLYSTTSSSMTVETCITACATRGFRYAGVQIARECRCGNSYGSQGIAAVTECSSACAGDSGEKCGGSLRNSVFDITLI